MPKNSACSEKKEPVSGIRKAYIARLVGRCLVLVVALWLYVACPDSFRILEGVAFFSEFSLFHLLWFVWIVDMIYQLVPVKDKLPLGSQKLFLHRFKPLREKINYHALREYVISTTKAAYKVFILWTALIGGASLFDQRCFLRL